MRHAGHDHGFTLFEILIAMAVLAIGALGAATLMTTVLRGNTLSTKVMTATTLVQDKLEEVKNAGYTAAACSTELAEYDAGTQTYRFVARGDQGCQTVVREVVRSDQRVDQRCQASGLTQYDSYKRVTTVAGPPEAAPGTKKVTVAVLWSADTHCVALHTILARK